MRHRKNKTKFGRPRAQRKALVKSLVRSILINERIKTTQLKAKNLRPWIDKMITWAKEDSLHSRRLAYDMVQDHLLVKKLFDSVGPRYKDIGGGYCRIYGLGFRRGDGAKMVLMELTQAERKDDSKKKIKKEEAAVKTIQEKETKPSQGFISGVRNIFKKEREN